MNQILAALDAGTNTMRLLVAHIDEDGKIIDHTRELRYVGLGEGVDAIGLFTDASMARGLAVVDEYVDIMRQLGVERARFVATSAARDARNRDEFFDAVRSRLGFDPELIAGDEEARLSFLGAVSGARLSGEPVLVMDSGGGSTELVRGTADGRLEGTVSFNMGSRRIRERFLHHDPPAADEIEAARRFVDAQLDSCPFPLDSIHTYVGVAGTVTTMAALVLGLQEFDPTLVHGASIDVAQTSQITQRLLSSTITEVREMGPVSPERAKVLCAGALIVSEVTNRVAIPLQACESDILDGVVLTIGDGGHPFA